MINIARLDLVADETALFLDIDGTLLDIASRPDDVVVSSSIRTSLMTVSQALGGAVALVSGRRIDEIDRLFAPLLLAASGVHGSEFRLSPAAAIEHLAARVPDRIRAGASAIVSGYPGALFEDKGVAVAVHWRLAPQFGETIERELREMMAGETPDFSILRGHCVLEIKGSALDKGVAVDRFMGLAPFMGRQPIFIGDDVTDETGFAAVTRAGGRAFAVSRPIDGTIDWFQSPSDVRRWLGRIAQAPVRAVA